MRADVRREEDVRKFVDACVKRYGRVDVAFNNAGVEAVAANLPEQTLENFLKRDDDQRDGCIPLDEV